MTKKAKLVVVFPIFNGAKTMLRTLQCVADQELQDFRAVIVENKSTDGTLEIATKFCEIDPRFEVLENEKHLGAIDNFMHSIRVGSARGEYFCLMACDDLLSRDYLRRLLEALESNPNALLAVGSSERVKGDNVQLIKPAPEIFNFQINAGRGAVPRGLYFPSEWFFGIYRSKAATEILLERWPALGGPWCAASYTVAEFVVRDLVVWVDGPRYIFFLGSASEDLYAAKSLRHKIYIRWLYAAGCYRVVEKLPPLSWNTKRKIFMMFWRDASRKTNYSVRKHILRAAQKMVGG